MFYRRKLLLSLIEVFGGKIALQDCYTMVYLFCLKRGKNYYDFFPYAHGYFSVLLDQDQQRLSSLDFLTIENNEIYLANKNVSFEEQVSVEDRRMMQILVKEIGILKSQELLERVTDSRQVFDNVLSKRKSMPCLFTLGYEGLSIDAFLNMLLLQNVSVLVDVRKNPISMKYGFSKKRLADCVKKVGIAYVHVPELGVPSSLRRELNDEMAYKNLFAYYQVSILPQHETSLNYVKGLIDQYGRIALTCFEANPHFCHRHKITEYLEHDPCFDVPIIHLQKDCTVNAKIGYTSSNEYILHTAATS